MSEERKPEESLMSDENLFVKYFAAARMADNDATTEQSFEEAIRMIEQHRKLFPKKVPRDSHSNCGGECVKCYPIAKPNPEAVNIQKAA